MYFKHISTRFFHLSKNLCADKNALAALRKKTGYTFANCKKALEMHENDLTKAEKWLQEQAESLGWSKATKLEGRSASQGLVGVLVQRNIGALVEINCETDFVSRNENFREFVEKTSKACLNYVSDVKETEGNVTKIALESESLKNLKLEDGKMLSDHLALLIGKIGENTVLKRAICYKTADTIKLFGFTHPAPESIDEEGKVIMGRYGAIAAFNSNTEASDEVRVIYRKICQHIVGMNPEKIGDTEIDKPNEVKDDEKCLIYQDFILDSEMTIGEILKENNIKIIDFHRFECGEEVKVN
ncbi:hypothetical protein PVAND_006897 [Polypedilum vanderplanki]|uniref:Elongation factor Ts, mitochondrial n=1 Tax=Polypedilum vanderplanki TaxID=319348 RepID=A0A9J6C519_POLVA|nr:hypothetical protein PVAND_006897 [Polypedilum vanderplanki]